MNPRKVALVTGAGKRRVGAHVADALANRGEALVIHYRSSAPEANEAVARYRDRGVEAVALQADLSDEKAVQTLVAQALGEFGTPVRQPPEAPVRWHGNPPWERPPAGAGGRRGGTGKYEEEQAVRQVHGDRRRECAPRRTREKDHLGALSKPAGGGSLPPEQIGDPRCARRWGTAARNVTRVRNGGPLDPSTTSSRLPSPGLRHSYRFAPSFRTTYRPWLCLIVVPSVQLSPFRPLAD